MRWLPVFCLALTGCASHPMTPTGHGYRCSGENVVVCDKGDDKSACKCMRQDDAERQLGMWGDYEDG